MKHPNRRESVHIVDIDYHAMQKSSPDTSLLLDLEQDRLIDANHHAARLFGRSREQFLHSNLAALCPPRQPDGRLSELVIAERVAQVLGGDARIVEATFLRGDGMPMDCEMRMLLLPVPGRRLLHVRLIDITDAKLAEALRAGQSILLEMIAKGEPLARTLDHLTRLIEAQSAGVYCTVLLLAEDGLHTRHGAAPSLPQAYADALDGLEIGPAAGSCGTAMFRREPVIVRDILSDPLWAGYRDLVAPYGLRACWSVPIIQSGRVLGSFAMYYREVRSPGPNELRLIDVGIYIAGIAIERTQREEELQRHREHLEELVVQRTAALTQAKDQTERANEGLATALENLCLAQDELVRRDKLAALGALVAGIAHELNTPIGNSLVAASTMAERTHLLRVELDNGLRRSALAGYLDEAEQADAIVLRNLQRAANLVASFKQIAVDRASSQRRRFALRQFIAELILPLRLGLKNQNIVVEQEVADGLVLDSYPGPLGQVLSNLFENCVLHGFEGRPSGVISIRATAGAAGEIVLSMADNGAGIAAADLPRIYDPFFTTKLGSGGSGLGLHIAHNIVTGVLGGRIEASSVPGQGTAITLSLPAVAPLVASAAAPLIASS